MLFNACDSFIFNFYYIVMVLKSLFGSKWLMCLVFHGHGVTPCMHLVQTEVIYLAPISKLFKGTIPHPLGSCNRLVHPFWFGFQRLPLLCALHAARCSLVWNHTDIVQLAKFILCLEIPWTVCGHSWSTNFIIFISLERRDQDIIMW